MPSPLNISVMQASPVVVVFCDASRDVDRNPLTFLDGLQIGYDGPDIVALKFELGHVRVAGDDALAQRFLQRLDGVAPCQGAE